MKRTSAFLELAEKIIKNPTGDFFVCFDLEGISNREWFTDLFKPTPEEAEQYEMWPNAWLSNVRDRGSDPEANYFRILCLLLAHEIWCDTIDKD